MVHFGTVGNTIRLRSGRYLDLADPKPEQFTLADISGGLSKLCRFGGQIELGSFYSVAEHSVCCSFQGAQDDLPREVQLALLLHDATESFLGDVVKPLKVMLEAYQVAEQRMEHVIAEKYGVDFSHPAIKEIDHAMLIHERKELFRQDGVMWSGEDGVRSLDMCIWCEYPVEAEVMFLLRAAELGLHFPMDCTPEELKKIPEQVRREVAEATFVGVT